MVLARDYASITSLNISKWDISESALRVVLTKFPRLKVLRLPPLCKYQYYSIIIIFRRDGGLDLKFGFLNIFF
jgi:hypothetical protein